ncbi:MAG: hypothetical protein HFJ38_04745 [Bacilli bacterium]|nr:hypothetical protein [Bacilli bacterium]
MFNNPFMYTPYMNSAANMATPAISKGLFSSIKAINWGGILSNTQKTLGIINQTIPIVYQVKPIINNAKTMFKIANTIKSDNKENKNQIQTSKTENINSKNMHNYNENTNIDNNKPMFFI